MYHRKKYDELHIENSNKKILYFPTNLKKLTLTSYEFPLDNLPSKLKYLRLNDYGSRNFDVKINDLPDSIEEIYCDIGIKEFIKFPNKLKKLILLTNYRFKLNNLPEGLKTLSLVDYHYDLENLPPLLEELSISNDNYKCLIDNLPLSLKILNINVHKTPNFLPNSLEKLYISFSKDSQGNDQDLSNLPQGLKFLSLTHYKLTFDNLPDELEELELHHYKKRIYNLPKNLKSLIISNYDFELDNLPNNLKSLKLHYYHMELNNLPDNLEELYLPLAYTKKISILPSNLKKIYIPFDNYHKDKIIEEIKDISGDKVEIIIHLFNY